jgi:hypothetical protein
MTRHDETRQVVVKVYGARRQVYTGNVVLTAPADASDDEIGMFLEGMADQLPEPDDWDEQDDDHEVEIIGDADPIVLGIAPHGDEPTAVLGRDEDGYLSLGDDEK